MQNCQPLAIDAIAKWKSCLEPKHTHVILSIVHTQTRRCVWVRGILNILIHFEFSIAIKTLSILSIFSFRCPHRIVLAAKQINKSKSTNERKEWKRKQIEITVNFFSHLFAKIEVKCCVLRWQNASAKKHSLDSVFSVRSNVICDYEINFLRVSKIYLPLANGVQDYIEFLTYVHMYTRHRSIEE